LDFVSFVLFLLSSSSSEEDVSKFNEESPSDSVVELSVELEEDDDEEVSKSVNEISSSLLFEIVFFSFKSASGFSTAFAFDDDDIVVVVVCFFLLSSELATVNLNFVDVVDSSETFLGFLLDSEAFEGD
jgi:hypothetical protein